MADPIKVGIFLVLLAVLVLAGSVVLVAFRERATWRRGWVHGFRGLRPIEGSDAYLAGHWAGQTARRRKD